MLYLVPKVETTIIAPLEMVSPMFIASPTGWSHVLVLELATSLLSVHVHRFRIFTCRILKELTKVCPAHTDKAEIKCMGSIGGKTATKPKSFIH